MGPPMEIPLHDRLDGQVALVSGANRGIGAEIARQLAELGCTVFAGSRDPAELEGVEDASDGGIRAVRLDVEEETDIQAAVASAAASGRLDILVNNAGIGDWKGATLQSEDTGLVDKILRVNLRGAILLAKHALPHLLEQDAPRVVNVSSGYGALNEGMSGTAPVYRISKAGMNGLTGALHGDYGPRGLLANSVCPGWVRTRLGGENAPRPPSKGAETPVWLARFAAGAPGGRFWRDMQPIEF